MLENLVFVALRRVTSEFAYSKTKNGNEVDIIAEYPERSRALIQLCESIVDPNTRKSELDALAEAMRELSQIQRVVVTRGEIEDPKVDGETVNVEPAWRFLL